MRPRHHRPSRTLLGAPTRTPLRAGAVLAVSAVGLAGLVVAPQAPSAVAAVAACVVGDDVNPMLAAWPTGSSSPFSIRTTGDLVMQNQEIEGSAAVGGTLRVSGRNDYPVLHSLGGYGDYAPPTVDGDPTWLLLNAWQPTGSVVKIKASSTSGPSPVVGGFKIVDPGAASLFALFREGAGGTGLAVGGASAGNMDPAIEAWHQPWDGGASAVPAQAVADDFPADAGASHLAQLYATGTRVTSGAGGPEKTFTLTEGVPAWITVGDLLAGGTTKFALTDGVDAGTDSGSHRAIATTTFVVRVTAGDLTAGVVTLPELVARQQAEYVLYDLSGLPAGTSVELRTAGKLGGAVYAPGVDVTMSGGTECEGQIFAASYTNTADREFHTFLFKGTVPCAAGVPTPTATPTATPVPTPTSGPTSAATPTPTVSGLPTSTPTTPVVPAPTTGGGPDVAGDGDGGSGATDGGSSTLAATGGAARVLLPGGVLALALGALLVAVRRRASHG